MRIPQMKGERGRPLSDVPPELDKSVQLERAQNALKQLQSIRERLIRTEDFRAIDEKIKACKDKIFELQSVNIEAICPNACAINTQVFKDRTDGAYGWPKHAPFSLLSDVCKLSNNGRFYQTFPKSIREFYTYVAPFLSACTYNPYWTAYRFNKTFQKSLYVMIGMFIMLVSVKVSSWNSVLISCVTAFVSFVCITTYKMYNHRFYTPLEREIEVTFPGFFPPEINTLIELCKQSNLFEEIFVLSKDVLWMQNKVSVNHWLIGFDGQRFWRLSEFNSATLEEKLR